jgi:hypothetical protein
MRRHDSSWRTAVSATLHCLTGCAIGEILGMILATWWGWGNVASIALAVGSLAFSLAVAFVVTVPINRWMIGRGKGHAVVHEYHHGH